jgi:hypothetical protein
MGKTVREFMDGKIRLVLSNVGMIKGHKGRKGKVQLSTHDLLEADVWKTLAGQGWEVYRVLEGGGKDWNPDLFAERKGGEMLIECKNKESDRFVRQLENMSKMGKVILWLDIDTTNVELRGKHHLIEK